jgi:hypothetical protein
MGLMVYAPHGRTGVYMLQDALRLLAPETEAPPARLDVARRVLRHLPETAWLRFNRGFTEHMEQDDAGIYDLLLNPRDRAYDVPALHALLAAAGLDVTAWMEPIRYDPLPLLPDPRLRARAERLDPLARAALAEALTGNMPVHVVYCRRSVEPVRRADALAPEAVPVTREVTGEALAGAIRPDGMMGMMFDGLRLPVALPPLAPAILRLVDGRRSVGTIAAMLAERGIAAEAFARGWPATFGALERVNRLLLAGPG